MVTPIRVDGIDISHHQSTNFNYDLAKKHGLRFVYHKATEGTTFRDQLYARRRAEAAKAGLKFGAYHFARPRVGNARAQAKYFLAYAKVEPGDMAPVLDLEANDYSMNRVQLTTWVGTFVNEVHKQLGVKPIIYTPYDLNKNYGCKLWVARYSNSNAEPRIPNPWKTADIRQFSNGRYGVPSTLAGIGRVDLDHITNGKIEPLLVPEKPAPAPPAPRHKHFIDGDLRMITFNTHVGQSIRNGTLADIIKWGQPDVLFLQELTRPITHRKALRRVLGPDWYIIGRADSFLALRKERFHLNWGGTKENSFGENHVRYAVRCSATDLVTGRVSNFQSVHCQPLGKGLIRAFPGARARQTKQLETYTEASAGRNREHVVVDAGDFNQDMDTSYPKAVKKNTAIYLWSRAKMVPLNSIVDAGGPVHLDEFMVRPSSFYHAMKRDVYSTHRAKDDHDAVLHVAHISAIK